MKKFSFLSATVMMATAVLLFASCQKESSKVEDPTTDTGVEGAVNAKMGSGTYAGSVSASYAQALASNYEKKFGDDASQTVAFSAKDLISFLQGLQTNNKSDLIIVNFGVYGRGAAPVSSKDYGKLTVFFTGAKTSNNSGSRAQGAGDIPSTPDQYLNHGTIYP